jgi:hypothetical protein
MGIDGSAPYFQMAAVFSPTYSVCSSSSATHPLRVEPVVAAASQAPSAPPRTSWTSILPALSISSSCSIWPLGAQTKA